MSAKFNNTWPGNDHPSTDVGPKSPKVNHIGPGSGRVWAEADPCWTGDGTMWGSDRLGAYLGSGFEDDAGSMRGRCRPMHIDPNIDPPELRQINTPTHIALTKCRELRARHDHKLGRCRHRRGRGAAKSGPISSRVCSRSDVGVGSMGRPSRAKSGARVGISWPRGRLGLATLSRAGPRHLCFYNSEPDNGQFGAIFRTTLALDFGPLPSNNPADLQQTPRLPTYLPTEIQTCQRTRDPACLPANLLSLHVSKEPRLLKHVVRV